MHGVALARIAGVSRNLTRAILSKRRFSVAVLPVMCRSKIAIIYSRVTHTDRT
jgi:hypothetical protein